MIVVESLSYINILSENLEKSIEFYTMLFDFELQEKNDKTAIINFDNLTIRLIYTEKNEDIKSYPLMSFVMDVDDFTDALQEIEANEIKIMEGPTETEKGENLMVSDPSGNIIELYYEE